MCSLDLFTIPCQVVLERELEGHLGDFGQNSADEILLPVKFGVFFDCTALSEGMCFGVAHVHSGVQHFTLRQTTMQPDADGVVGFLQFWKGMEDPNQKAHL